jgi:hypothetical protein
MRRSVGAIEAWVSGLREAGHLDLKVRYRSQARRTIRIKGVELLRYEYANEWLYCLLLNVTPEETNLLTTRLSNKRVTPRGGLPGAFWFHVVNDSDLELLKEILLGRIKASPNRSRAERLDTARV